MSPEFHEFAEIFPMMSEEALSSLAADIKANGLREPVRLFEGRILDGRNRFLACRRAGVPATFEEFRGDRDAALRFVISLNLERRHLDESQRAMAGARIKPMFDRLASERQNATRALPGQKIGSNVVANLPPPSKSRDDAARAVNVSPRSVESAAKVLREGAPELVHAVERGSIAVSTAAAIAEAPREQQKIVVTLTPKEIVQKAKEIKQQQAEARREKAQSARDAADWTLDQEQRREAVMGGATVVANIKTDLALIGWATKKGIFVQIDRTTDWGNPFNLGEDGTRDYVCESFAMYLDRKLSLKKRLPHLTGKVLGCWCYPERCHGQELINAIG